MVTFIGKFSVLVKSIKAELCGWLTTTLFSTSSLKFIHLTSFAIYVWHRRCVLCLTARNKPCGYRSAGNFASHEATTQTIMAHLFSFMSISAATLSVRPLASNLLWEIISPLLFVRGCSSLKFIMIVRRVERTVY